MSGSEAHFVDHLQELRRRLIVCVLAVMAVAAAAFFGADRILQLLLLPSGGLKLRAFSIMDGFLLKMRLALYAGIVLASPVWLFQALRFIGPGLLPRERRTVLPFLAGGLALFAAGTGFGYYLLWGMIRVLVQLFPTQVEYLPSANDYVSFVTFFLLACGAAFQLPCALVLLARLGVVRSSTLRKGRRTAYFLLFAFAEIITPVVDPIIAPLTVMVPMVALYELGILLARRIEVRRDASPTVSSRA